MQANSITTQPVSRYLLAGLISGLISAVIANIYYLIYSGASGNSFAELNLFTITFIAVLGSVIGGLVYYGLTRFTKQPSLIFSIVGVIFIFLSIIPNFASPLYPNFAAATVPMHFIVGLTAIAFIPWFVRGQR